MIIAALVTFAILLVAWIVAPSAPSGRSLSVTEPMTPLEPAPLAEAA